MLYSHFQCAQPGQPVAVFLHGLLGSSDDWQTSLNQLATTNTLTIDLPGHGQSQAVECEDFDHCCQLIQQAILRHVSPQTPVVLVGYSLGARLVMYGVAFGRFSRLNLQLLLLEGGNFGLETDQQREERWRNDKAWAERFEGEPIEQVLNDWYQQPVFSSLNHEQRQILVAKRSANLGVCVANMLCCTSLAKQPNLLTQLQSISIAAHYICGIKDKKFSAMAEQSGLSYSQVANAGHNVHQEQPRAFAHLIFQHLQAISSSSLNQTRE